MDGKTKSNPVFVLLLSLCDKQAKKDNYDAFAHFFVVEADVIQTAVFICTLIQWLNKVVMVHGT